MQDNLHTRTNPSLATRKSRAVRPCGEAIRVQASQQPREVLLSGLWEPRGPGARDTEGFAVPFCCLVEPTAVAECNSVQVCDLVISTILLPPALPQLEAVP